MVNLDKRFVAPSVRAGVSSGAIGVGHRGRRVMCGGARSPDLGLMVLVLKCMRMRMWKWMCRGVCVKVWMGMCVGRRGCCNVAWRGGEQVWVMVKNKNINAKRIDKVQGE